MNGKLKCEWEKLKCEWEGDRRPLKSPFHLLLGTTISRPLTILTIQWALSEVNIWGWSVIPSEAANDHPSVCFPIGRDALVIPSRVLGYAHLQVVRIHFVPTIFEIVVYDWVYASMLAMV